MSRSRGWCDTRDRAILPSPPAEKAEGRFAALRLDPRGRVLAAVAFSVVVAVANGFATLAAALVLTILAVLSCGWPVAVVLRRLAPLNSLLLALVAILPWTVAGDPLWQAGPLTYSSEGLRLAARIALKGNAIVLSLLLLLGSLDGITLGRALAQLRLPDKLIHLLLFTIRYLEVLGREYGRLRVAMRTRGFRARFNRHTWRSYGHLIGMLLVRSLDRAERIGAAMKCRGFRGRFYLGERLVFSQHDAWFAVAATAVLLGLVFVEWFVWSR